MANQLFNSGSSYLQQHANNPVEWYPWGEEALQRAHQEKKPILLSIGYSACHWCHVMAEESFADLKTAELMNKYFINIKVDREERPDIDKIYQAAHHLLNKGSGGWPLTVFLTHDEHIPFFAGTYFPARARYGLPSFQELLKDIHKVYLEQQDNIRAQNQQVLSFLKSMQKSSVAGVTLNEKPILQAQITLPQEFDVVHGGLFDAPKFPQPVLLKYLLNQQVEKLTQHVLFTLEKMAQGGIYDQLGGGFFRYSVDAHWEIPHFEKMLYDNAQLLTLYSQAYSLTHDSQYLTIIDAIVNWALREMREQKGGFYSSLDADSEHQEGKFYYWDREEIKTLLFAEEFDIMTQYFNLNKSPNFEGHWHLHCQQKIDPCNNILITARKKLFKQREQRARPHRDEKILTAWNALMIKGLADAYQATYNSVYLTAAEQALNFIQQTLWQNEQLWACYAKQTVYQTAFLDDYAYALSAILSLLQQRWNTSDLLFAIKLADYLLEHFATSNGGFYFTDNTQEKLFYRPQPWQDEAVPSGNGIAAQSLLRLGYLLGEPRYLLAAENALKVIYLQLQKYPSAHTSLLTALKEYLTPPQIIVIRGEINDIAEWHKISLSHFNPHRLSFAIANHEINLPGGLAAKATSTVTIAYICSGTLCEEPATSIERFKEAIS